jgi:glycosyltransferase involved in cell wall biosynthesis
MTDQNLFLYDSAKESDRVSRNIEALEGDIKHVLAHLYKDETGALSNMSQQQHAKAAGGSTGAAGIDAPHYHVRTTSSDMVTLVIPLRGRLLPLGHITYPGLCRTPPSERPPADQATLVSDTAFTRMEVIFAATSLLKTADVASTLPGQWTPVKDIALPITLSSLSILHAQELTDRSTIDPMVRIPHCVERIVVAIVRSKANGLETFVDPIDTMLGKHLEMQTAAATQSNAPQSGAPEPHDGRRVVPFGQLVLAALRLSDVSASHFIVMSEAVMPTRVGRTPSSSPPNGSSEPSTPTSFLDDLMAPFLLYGTSGAPLTAGGENIVPVMSQCTLLQPSAWGRTADLTATYKAMGPVFTQEERETPSRPTITKAPKGKRNKRYFSSLAPPFALQQDAHLRFQWDKIRALQSSAQDLVVVDRGAESGTGSDRQFATQYIVRRLHGFSASDGRVGSPAVEQVDMASPYCTAFDRRKYLLLGGLRNDGSEVFTSRIYAGLFSQEIRHRVLMLVKLRVTLVERIMESISLVEVHKAGNVLRQQVRLAYSQVVESMNLWEDVTGGKYDRTLRSDPLTAAMLDLETASQQEHFGSTSKVEERLAWQTSRLHDATKELLKLGKNKDSGATEDEVGWDLSLRLQRFDRSWRIFSANATAVLLREWLPYTYMSYFASNHMALVHPSYMADGSFQDLWGKALIALHRSRAGIPYDSSSQMQLRERALQQRPLTVYWSSFCCGCCGFSSEIVQFIFPLARRRRVHIFNDEFCFCRGYPSSIQDTLKRLFMQQEHYLIQYRDPREISVWISHTDPNSYVQVITEKRRPTYFVGRSMYEFSKVPGPWIKNIEEHCDEVWVPCAFVRNVFVGSGVRPEKVVIIPEALDTYFYDPEAHHPIPLPFSESRPSWRVWENRKLSTSGDYEAYYKFYSSFKWEPRKGWEILLMAYYRGFAANRTSLDDPFPKVSLYIQTFMFLNTAIPKGYDIRNVSHILHTINHWIQNTFPPEDHVTLEGSFPHLVFVTEHVTEMEQVALYRTMDAFVLPTRGEGWGLPTIQALSMGMPTISTNWGGNTEFMSRSTSFLIPVDGLEELPLDSYYQHEEGKKWAIPNVDATMGYLQWCAAHPDQARAIGRRAREDIHRRFGEEAVADIVDARIEEIRKIVEAREGTS